MQTFDQVNRHVEENHTAAMRTTTKPDWKHILAISLPVLTFLTTAFFVPKKWRDIIGVLVIALQSLPDSTTIL